MLFFVISLAVGIAAVLGAQKLDIEMLNPPAPKRPAAKPIAKAPVALLPVITPVPVPRPRAVLFRAASTFASNSAWQ